jgi:signal transduction histidine kinase
MADRAKGIFISNISHELRSPLHGILASAEFLSDTQVDPLQQTFIDTIDTCGRTLLDVINHVFDFGKLMYNTRTNKPARPPILHSASQENTSQSVGAEATDLLAITEQIVESCHAGCEFEGLFGQADIGSIFGDPAPSTNAEPCPQNGYGRAQDSTSRLTVVIDVEYRKEGWLFLSESGAIQRIIMNITGNALKYTSSGWVRVQLSTQQSKAQRTVHITVSDSGKGISPEFLRSQLFRPFAQEDALQAGTGLGMSIVKQVVERIGGEIKVSSIIDIGTQVDVVLPGVVFEPPDGALDIFARLRSRANGKKVFLAGFDHNVSASRLLFESLAAYLTSWYCMQVVEEMEISDLIVSDECPELRNSFSQQTAQSGRPTVFSNQIHPLRPRAAGHKLSQSVFCAPQPLIVLCSNALRYEFFGQQIQGSKIVDFATKPCGPSKLARSLLFCLDKSETASWDA